MAVLDHVAMVASESARFRDALGDADLTAAVPSCPDWDGAALAWHLAEVQSFWATIVERLLDDPEGVEQPPRLEGPELLDLVAEQSGRLVAALTRRSPTDGCWSWHAEGRSVAWVRRRQAHEALIHRVDAELLAGLPVAGVDAPLAADGVDEFVDSMFGSPLPDWARFSADGQAISLEAIDVDARWTLEFGRFAGTSPVSGTTYDEDDVRPRPEPGAVGATVRGTAWDLDRWLWGRGEESALDVSGEHGLVGRLRATAAASTQ
jgi:uncharacterized protein (TIGR03083 family)